MKLVGPVIEPYFFRVADLMVAADLVSIGPLETPAKRSIGDRIQSIGEVREKALHCKQYL